MDPKLVTKFKNRWKHIENIERKELLYMLIKEKLLKTISAMKLGFVLGYSMDKATIKDIEKVRLHWKTLKKLQGEKNTKINYIS